jgi:hypothetical protein
MTKKILLILISKIFLYAVTPVTDTDAYYYLINQINQTTQLLNGTSQQIATLGAIRMVMDDVKSDINDAKSNLKGSVQSLENAGKNFENTIDNVEIKSLLNLDAERTTVTGTGTGIAYNDLARVFTDSFKKADDGLINMFGGKTNLNYFMKNQHQLTKALRTNSIEDFKRVMNENIDSEQVKNEILIHDYIEKTKNLDTQAKQSISAQLISQEWQKTFFPTTENQLQEKEERKQRMSELIGYIENSKDMRQSIKTTNMLLMELLQLAQKNFNSALHFRNAMASMYLRNGKGSELATELKKRQEELEKSKKSLPQSIRNTPVSKMNGTSPYGIGWRPLQ